MKAGLIAARLLCALSDGRVNMVPAATPAAALRKVLRDVLIEHPHSMARIVPKPRLVLA
jgi:hypothetical protein